MKSGAKFLFIAFLCFSFIWLFVRCLLPFLLPFLLGAGLALAAEPLTARLCRSLRLPRALAAGAGVSCTFFLLFSLLFLLLALLFRGLTALGQILPDLAETVLSGLGLLEQWLLSLAARTPQGIRPFVQKHVLAFFSDGTAFLDQGARFILGLAGGFLTHIPDRFFTLFTALISGYMISAKLPGIRALLKDQLSRQKILRILALLRRLKSTAGAWILA